MKIEFSRNLQKALKDLLPAIGDKSDMCHVSDPSGWTCTLPGRHDGAHVGHDYVGGTPMVVWGKKRDVARLFK